MPRPAETTAALMLQAFLRCVACMLARTRKTVLVLAAVLCRLARVLLAIHAVVLLHGS